MQDSKKTIKNIALTAVFLAISVIISFVESLSGINALIPFPGVRLGLCNIAITATLYICGTSSAFSVAFLRPLFLFLFSANPVSFLMSLFGGMCSFTSLVLTKKMYGKIFSFAGISCISATFHSIGQILAATLLMNDNALLLYLPLLVGLSSVMGSISGFVMNVTIPRLKGAFDKRQVAE